MIFFFFYICLTLALPRGDHSDRTFSLPPQNQKESDQSHIQLKITEYVRITIFLLYKHSLQFPYLDFFSETFNFRLYFTENRFFFLARLWLGRHCATISATMAIFLSSKEPLSGRAEIKQILWFTSFSMPLHTSLLLIKFENKFENVKHYILTILGSYNTTFQNAIITASFLAILYKCELRILNKNTCNTVAYSQFTHYRCASPWDVFLSVSSSFK